MFFRFDPKVFSLMGDPNVLLDEIIFELPLKERTDIANMNEEDVEVLQRVFDFYVRRKIGSKAEDDEYSDIMNELWERLRETHRLRVVR